MSGRKGTAAFLAVVVTACAWPFLLKVFVAPQPTTALWLLVGALLLAALGSLGGVRIEPFKPVYLTALPFLILGGLLVPWPYGLGAFVLAGALALCPSLKRFRGLTPIVFAILLIGLVLLVQGMLLPIAQEGMARWHRIGGLPWLIAWLLRLFGVDASAMGTSVFAVAVRRTMEFRVSPELLGLPVALLALAGGVLVDLTLGGRPGRAYRLPMMVVSWLAFLVLRAVLMILLVMQLQLYVEYDDPAIRADVLWNPWWSLVSFLPLALVWAGLCRLAPLRARKQVFRRYRPLADSVTGVLAFIGIGLLVFAFTWHGSGAYRGGRIIIDESHSDWEKTNRILDTRWYGNLSMYNMFSLSDYLEYFYAVSRNTRSPITPELLSQHDILIVKVPTRSYEREEVDAIVDFVGRGGGLFMIAEHTNYLGSAEHMDNLSQRFGMHVEEDGLFNLTFQTEVAKTQDTRKIKLPYFPNKPFNQVWLKPSGYAHPIAAPLPVFRCRPSPLVGVNFVEPMPVDFSYRFQVSCSARSSDPFVRPVMLSTGMYRIFADYHMGNFYPPPEIDTNLHFGAFTQMLAGEFGRGRVTLFTDSTTFSNFTAFYPGNSELMLATMSWLNREHMGAAWRIVTAVLGVMVMFLAAALVFAKSDDRVGSGILLIVGLFLGASVTLAVCRLAAHSAHPLPRPHTRPTSVAFLREHCDYDVPLADFVTDYDLSYNLFYQWVLRLRYFPRIRFTLDDALDDDVLVIPNPYEPFSDDELSRMRQYLEDGGKVLVLLRPAYLREAQGPSAGEVIDLSAAAESLLSPFDMGINSKPKTVFGGLTDAAGEPTGTGAEGVVVEGATPLYRIDGKAVVAAKQVGKGQLIVAGIGDLFVDGKMGVTYGAKPDLAMRARYGVQFDLLRRLLPPKDHLPPRVLRQIENETTLAP